MNRIINISEIDNRCITKITKLQLQKNKGEMKNGQRINTQGRRIPS